MTTTYVGTSRAKKMNDRRFGNAPRAERYGAHPGSPQAGHAAAIKALWQLAYREASTLAYADAFRLIMIVLVIATLLVPLMRKVVRPGLPRRRHIRTPCLRRSESSRAEIKADCCAQTVGVLLLLSSRGG
jgi:hypothetical protein